MARASDIGRLGGGWIAAAVGLSEYASPLDAYQRVVGEVVDQREGEAIDRGNFLEPALRNWHHKKLETASTIIAPGTLFKREPGWATYTPDGIVTMKSQDQFLAEYKAPGPEVALKYGEAGTDEVPRDVGVQVHWGLFVTDLPKADVAALIGGELKLFHLSRDPDLERELFDRAKFFMERYVATKTPPPPTYSERDTEWVKKRWPHHQPEKVLEWGSLSVEEQRLVNRYIAVYQEFGAIEKVLQELENAVKLDVVKDATRLNADAGCAFSHVTWKNNEVGAPKWKDIAMALAKYARLSEPELADLIEKGKFKSDPPRVFRPWFPRKK